MALASHRPRGFRLGACLLVVFGSMHWSKFAESRLGDSSRQGFDCIRSLVAVHLPSRGCRPIFDGPACARVRSVHMSRSRPVGWTPFKFGQISFAEYLCAEVTALPSEAVVTGVHLVRPCQQYSNWLSQAKRRALEKNWRVSNPAKQDL